MTEIVIGFGEIGRAVYELLNTGTSIEKIYVKDFKRPFEEIPVQEVDVMHICIPYGEDFLKDVLRNGEQFAAKHVVIWSTVPIGTTRKIPFAVHSPVEGKHPHLIDSLKLMTRWVGHTQNGQEKFFKDYFEALGLVVRMIPKPEYTEALKLVSTTEYGVNLVFADYKKRVADELDMDFQLMKDWNNDYNILYRKLGLGYKFQKFVLDPPEGTIGGHCVRENAAILQDEHDDDFLDLILETKGTNGW